MYEYNSQIDKLFDENNSDLIDAPLPNGRTISFEQIALIPIGDATYAILKPAEPLEGLGENEGLVYKIANDGKREFLEFIFDMEVIDQVFDVYDRLIEESEEN